MKRGFTLLLFVFLICSVSAISSDLKPNYEKGETIISEIKGDILENIDKNQVEFRRDHILVPFEYDFRKLGDRYFLWAIAPENENNYSLIIKDIITNVNGKVEKIDFIKNFSVSGNLTDYYIKPSFIIAKDDFSINVDLNGDAEKSINIDLPYQREILLKPGKNNVEFLINDFNISGLIMINIGKYSLPFYIIKEKNNENSTNNEIKLKIEPNAIVSTVYIYDKVVYPFRIINLLDTPVENINLEYNKELFSIDKDNFIILNNSFIELNVSFIGKIDEKIKRDGINDVIVINVNNSRLELPVIILFTENKTEAGTPYLENKTLYYCSELKGIVCSAGESCSGDIQASIDGACCIGKCNVKKEESSKSWIGYIIAFVLIIILIYIFKKYRKSKNRGNILDKKIIEAEGKMKNLP